MDSNGWIPNEWSNQNSKIFNHRSIYVHAPVAFLSLEYLIETMELTNSLVYFNQAIIYFEAVVFLG